MFEWIITSSVLIVVVAVLRYILKGKISLRIQYALWALVLIRLLIPFSIGNSSISVLNVADKVAEQFERQEPEELLEGEDKNVSEVAGNLGEVIYSGKTDVGSENNREEIKVPEEIKTPIHDYESAYKEELTATEQPTVEGIAIDEPDADIITFAGIIAIVKNVALYMWVAGMVIAVGYLLFVNVRFALLLRKDRKRLAGADDYPLPVYITDSVDTPCMHGIFSPKIYVTPEALKNEQVLKHVLEHESTHYRHKDHIWCVLRGMALAIHWYNPLVWLAAVLSRNDSELACDEATIKRIGEEERAEYGRTLIGMTCQKRSALFVNATTMTGSKKSIKERIVLIAKKPKMAIYTLVAVLVIAAIAVGCTFTGAGMDDTTVQGSEEQETTTQEEDTSTTEDEQPTTPEEQPTSSSDEKETTDNTEGTSGKEHVSGSVTWRIENDTLTISGTGKLEEGAWQDADFKHVIIEEGIEEIDTFAFVDCEKIESVIVPSTVKNVIGFAGCKNLKSVTFTEGIEQIDECAFERCSSLEKIVIPASVKGIGIWAFVGCTALDEVILEGSTVTNMEAFKGTPWLENEQKENPVVIAGNVLVDASKATGEVVIPEGVEVIGEFAFLGIGENAGVTSVVFPKSLKTISWRAFYGNTTIEKITFLGSVENISTEAFVGCDSLKEIIFPEGLVSIGTEAFLSCNSLGKVVFPKSLESLGRRAFEACTALKEVVIPEGFTGFEGNVFVRTAWLEEKQKDNPFVIVNSVLIDASTATGKVTVPVGIVTIAEDAFNGMAYLGDEFNVLIEEVVISDGVTNIASGAFNCCFSLKKVTIPESVVSIGEYAFDFENLEVICGVKGSYAEQYAKKMGVAFEDISSSFIFDGSAKEAAEYFVNTAYGDIRMNKVAPDSVYAITFYELIEYEILEISEDGTEITGTFKFAFDAENIEVNPWLAGRGELGEGKYEGKYTEYLYFRLFKKENSQWDFSVTTG